MNQNNFQSKIIIKNKNQPKIISSHEYPAFSQELFLKWTKCIKRLDNAGYGEVLVNSYIAGSKELAEKINPETAIRFADTVSILTIRSGRQSGVLSCETISTITKHNSSERSFINWLDLIEKFSKTTAHCVQPLLENIVYLLKNIDLPKLESWILTGLRLSPIDKNKQLEYFSLKSEVSRIWLLKETNSVNLSTSKKQLKLFLKALWNCDVPIREYNSNLKMLNQQRSSFNTNIINMPTTYQKSENYQNIDMFYASIAHIGAHLNYSFQIFEVKKKKPIQLAIISLIEDARVESLAIEKFPGLLKIWLPFHTVYTSDSKIANLLLTRLSRALIDKKFEDTDDWVKKGRYLFFKNKANWKTPNFSIELGNKLSNDLGQMRIQFDPKNYLIQPGYRDDNQGLWDYETRGQEQENQDTELFDTFSIKEDEKDILEPKEKLEHKIEKDNHQRSKSEPTKVDSILIAKHNEFDYLTGSTRSDWSTIFEHNINLKPSRTIDQVNKKYESTLNKLKKAINQKKIGKPNKLRNQYEGDYLNIDTCIEAKISYLSGESPDPRIYDRLEKNSRDLSVLILIDVSQSTDKVILKTGKTILDMEKETCALLSISLSELGDPFAIAAFCSNSREEVRYQKIKTFDEPYSALVKSKLAGIESSYSTRLGAAIRHSGQELSSQTTYRRLLLILTDGEPSDIDVTDEKYLAEDARHAVAYLAQNGIDTFCFGLETENQTYLTKIFGRKNSLQIRDIEELPERVLSMYLQLAT